MIAFLPKEQQLWVNTPHGQGIVLCVESHAHDNYTCTVILADDGRILHYSSIQLRASIHHTMEINLRDEKPKFPTEWKQYERNITNRVVFLPLFG